MPSINSINDKYPMHKALLYLGNVSEWLPYLTRNDNTVARLSQSNTRKIVLEVFKIVWQLQ